MSNAITIILACIGSSGLFTFLQFLINRKDKKKSGIDELKSDIASIKENLVKSEKDSVRTQMLIMMNHYPKEHTEIMKLAEYYFATLHSNWYMTSLFEKWCEAEGIDKPDWFEGTK